MTDRLPAELVDHVLQSLCSDFDERIELDIDDSNEIKNATFGALCLASQGMLQHAAPLLYSAVILTSPRKVQAFFASMPSADHAGWRLRRYLRHLWCGVVGEVLYDVPHKLASICPSPSVQQVAWMQADSAGRYHGFHYATRCSTSDAGEACDDDEQAAWPACVLAVHVICPDFGRWVIPLFALFPTLEHATLTLYPSGSWDIEEAKMERVLRGVLDACPHLKTLQLIVGHTVAAAGSRLVRMTRSIPISHAVRRVDDERITVSAAGFIFGSYGRSSRDEVILYTRQLWEMRRQGLAGPWPHETAAQAQ